MDMWMAIIILIIVIVLIIVFFGFKSSIGGLQL